jgi:hypothetical protein
MAVVSNPNTTTMSTLPPEGTAASDLRAATKVVRTALADMRHEMDVSDEDGAPDRQGWIELEQAATSLLLRAYYRNHNHAVLS